MGRAQMGRAFVYFLPVLFFTGQGEVEMEIRGATEADLQRITSIYNEVLVTSTAIFNEVPVTVEERIDWWKGRVQQGYPVLVATSEGSVLGFATF
jgi:phosphinothricin acetyltransferase